jgi:hypothetical protein
MRLLWAVILAAAGAVSVGAGEITPAVTRPAEKQGAATLPAGDAGAKLEVTSLVISKGAGYDVMRAVYDSGSGPIKPGTLVVARATLNDRLIIAAEEPVRVVRFGDDLETDLGSGRQAKRSGFDEATQTLVSPDRKSCEFWLYSEKLPKSGAGEIRINGTLPLRVGGGEKSFEVKDAMLKLGRKFEVGGLTLMVDGLHGDGSENGGMSVSMSSDRPLDDVRRIELFDAEGKPLATRTDTGYGRRRDTNRIYVSVSRKATVGSMKIVLFEKVETVQVPVELTVKAGI